MMDTSSYYTSAGNFISAVQGGVDPRTGLYNVRLPLANTHANRLMGPALSLSLFYSPLSTADNGFGKGFRLNLSRYDKNTRQLLLSTGEEYRTDSDDEVKQQKLKNFIFRMLDEETCEIIYKSGLRERLTLNTGDIYVPSEIITADGRSLSFIWDPNYYPARLAQVKDNNGIMLCSLTYPDSMSTQTIFTLLPENDNLGYEIVFNFYNEFLINVTSDAISPEISWTFDYDDVGFQNSYRVITAVYSPTGMTETVSYYTQADESMAFPEIANLPPLPCVYRHTLDCGGEQPQCVTIWSYTQKNYLGNDAGFNLWQPDTDQMLNFFLPDYLYGSTEERLDVDGSVLRTVTRSYNAYHLLASETTVRDGKTHVKTTNYYAIPGAEFDNQPSQYALPTDLTETWSDLEGNASRTEMTQYEFDEAGNPINFEKPDGTVINYSYYLSTGEDDRCPADPHGFVRYLEMQTITPPQITGDEPITTVVQTWQELDAINGDGYTVLHNTLEKTIGNKRSLTTYAYYTNPNVPENYGRVKSQNVILTPNIDETENYLSEERFTYDFNDGDDEITENHEFIGFDNLTTTETTVRNLWTGNVLSKTSTLDVTTCYVYDKLGRIISRTLCPDTEYENTTTWEYIIESDGPSSIETDAFGNQNKIQFDGTARAISHNRYDVESCEWYNTYSCAYNTLGEVIKGTANDWIRENGIQIPLTSDIIYDAWGEKQTVTFSDGKKTQHQTDPITLTQTSYTQGGTGYYEITSGTITTRLDEKSQLPVTKELKYPNGEDYSMQSYSWDGLGRMIEQVNECGAITSWTYDEYGRVLTQTLADGTILTRTYAPQFSGNQIASISVTGEDANGSSCTWLMGTQTFDSLGRLLQRESGGRSTLYHYEGASPVPSTITLPSGKNVEYVYIPELGNIVSEKTADDINQMFDYDKITGELTVAQEDTSKIENAWSPAIQLKQEIFFQNGEERLAKNVHTLKGTLISNTDVTGKETHYNMDEHGRVTNIIDNDLSVELSYDTLGQLSTQTVRSNVSSSFLTTDLNYDDFGREITRTITDNNGIKIMLSQAWTENNLLCSRNTQKNETDVLYECFYYDTRNRLTDYSAEGSCLPVDSYGNQMTKQTFCYDALNNLISVKTTLSDQNINTAKYYYENNNDPTQLTMLTNSNPNYPQIIQLTYDDEGRMIRDEAGRILNYDVMSRLTSMEDNNTGHEVTYTYDALNRVISRCAGNQNDCELYYRGAELINEINISAEKETRFIKAGHKCMGVSDETGLTLTAANKNDSLLWSKDASMSNNEGQFHVWSPYGSGSLDNRLPGFNGELVDPISGVYHLGNGYRAFNPVLMRFNCPDNLSPFNEGGINPYAYCSGDPINLTDPSGHLSGQAIAGIVLGAIGIAFSVFTAGASIAAAGGVMAALSSASTASLVIGGLGVVSDVTAIASGATEDKNPEASSTLGWVSLATGLTGMVAGVGVYLKPKISGMFKDVGSSMRPGGVAPPKSIYNLELPELRLRTEAPSNLWHEVVSQTDGHIVFGSDRTIVGSAIQEPLNRIALRNSNRDITILSGTHGRRYGNNWEHVPSRISAARGPDIRRAQKIIDYSFYKDDVRDYIPQYSTLNRKMHVIDMEDMIDHMFDYIVNDGRNHVILGYCYGRNDEALRYFMDLPPVISYVREM